jgi:hypothetical protein
MEKPQIDTRTKNKRVDRLANIDALLIASELLLPVVDDC